MSKGRQEYFLGSPSPVVASSDILQQKRHQSRSSATLSTTIAITTTINTPVIFHDRRQAKTIKAAFSIMIVTNLRKIVTPAPHTTIIAIEFGVFTDCRTKSLSGGTTTKYLRVVLDLLQAVRGGTGPSPRAVIQERS